MGRTPHYRRTPPTLKRAQAEAPNQATQLVRGFFARATRQRVLHYKHKNNPTETTQGSNTISSTTGTASTATSAHIYNWDNQETGTITSELTPATTFHTRANGYTGTDPTDGTITVTSGFPTKAVISNASLEQKCVLSQEYKNTPAWESVYTLTCDTNIGAPPDGVTAVWLSIYTINATR